MCGIAGIYYFGHQAPKTNVNTGRILQRLKHRGPDHQSYLHLRTASLFHSRLSIVDTSVASNQPFCDTEKTRALVFNGEIFNYRDLQKSLSHVNTTGDVEVLFSLLQLQGKKCLDDLNGFFAFGYYDEKKNTLLLARDRLGVKPLYYYHDSEKFIFASELKPLLEMAGPQALDHDQLYTYFRLNYCAGNKTIFKNVFRLLPGHYIQVDEQSVRVNSWYVAPKRASNAASVNPGGTLGSLLEDAVKLRLHADVPVGTFLSGGIDSSIISALAKKHKADLKTFSIGFADEKYFDETGFSELVATHIKSNHHVFKLKEDDFLQHIDSFLAAIDEPFADSSAFNFYMLSMYTRQHVKVALSGDGADELFKGYNKHRALLLSGNYAIKAISAWLPNLFPAGKSSRSSALQNKIRQLKKFNALSGLNQIEKQKLLASISTDAECQQLLGGDSSALYFNQLFTVNAPLINFELENAFDLQTVLSDDMLVKADRFSMRHGVEIRNPFLDYRVLEFGLNLPQHKKINATTQKIILRESFSDLLPPQIFSRGKKGFELPLQKWLTGQLRNKLENNWLSTEKIMSEGILDAREVKKIKNRLFSDDPGDSAARLWAIIIFESWLLNFKDYIKH